MSYGDRLGPETTEFAHATMQSLTEPDHAGSSTSFEQPRLVSNGESSISTVPTPEDGRIRILKELEKEVESFKSGRTTKTGAISSIIRLLGENSDVEVTQTQREATFDSYLTEILSIQSIRDNSAHLENQDDIAPTETTASGSGKVKQSSRRNRGNGDSDSEDEESKPIKKQKLLESDMPWFVPSDNSNDASNSSSQETCRLLRMYNRDISGANFLARVAPAAPTGIPSSQWEQIFKGESVDLNQIFASLHHVVSDEERTGRLGDTEISFGVAEPKK